MQGFFEDREGTLWVLTTRGIEAFRDLRVVSVTSREGLTADLANAVLAGNPFTLWRIRDRRVIEEIPSTTVPLDRSIVADPSEGIWLGLRNGDLGRYQAGQLETIPFHREPATSR